MEHGWWKVLLEREINQVYSSVALQSLATSMVALFAPIYLVYELGYSIEMMCIFYIIFSIFFALVSPFAGKIVARYGMKHATICSIPLTIIAFLSLYFIPSATFLFFIAAATFGAARSMFWLGIHLEFFYVSDESHRGEQVGIRHAATILPALFGPLLGGILIEHSGFMTTFLFASIILVGSAFLLLLSEDHHEPFDVNWDRVVSAEYWRLAPYYYWKGAWAIGNTVFWPFLIYGVLGGYVKLGIVATVLSVITVFMTVMMGRVGDKYGYFNVLRYAIPFESISWFLRHMVYQVQHVYAIILMQGLSHGASQSSLGAVDYKYVGEHHIEYFIVREMFISIGRLLAITIFMLFGYKYLFGLVGILSYSIFLL